MLKLGMQLPVSIFRENKHYIAYTPELDIASQGKSAVHAEERLREAVTLFLEETKRMGTLDLVLEKAGFLKKGHRWLTPQVSISSLEVVA